MAIKAKGLEKLIKLIRDRTAKREEKTKIVEEKLRQLIAQFPDISSAAILTLEGELIANAMPQFSPEKITETGKMMLESAKTIAKEYNRGEVTYTIIKGESGYITATNLGEAVLLTLSHRDVKLGPLVLSINRLITGIEEVL